MLLGILRLDTILNTILHGACVTTKHENRVHPANEYLQSFSREPGEAREQIEAADFILFGFSSRLRVFA
jgi:hypothetical protein